MVRCIFILVIGSTFFISLVFVALTNSIGGFEQFAPDTKLDDGNFTLILVKTDKILDMLSLLVQAMNGGQHVSDVNVEYLKTSKLRIETLDQEAESSF